MPGRYSQTVAATASNIASNVVAPPPHEALPVIVVPQLVVTPLTYVAQTLVSAELMQVEMSPVAGHELPHDATSHSNCSCVDAAHAALPPIFS